MRPSAPHPKYGLCTMSGAMISVISLLELVTSMVGMMPSVTPLLGSTAVSGTGSTGQVVGFSQLIFCCGFFFCFGFGAGMGPATCGAGVGDVVAWAAAVPGGAAAGAARPAVATR